MKFCQFCGSEMEDDVTFCAKCGKQTDGTVKEKRKSKKSRGKCYG